MSWSQQVMNGLETVFRTFDFARHVQDELAHAGDGRGLKRFEHWTGATGGAVQIPRWWLLGFADGSDDIVKDGRGRVAEWRRAHGRDPEPRLGLVYLCFWHSRVTDRLPVLLPPQIVVGAGPVTFREWGQAHQFAGGYLLELGTAVNEHRRQGDLSGLGVEPTNHLRLGEDFEWRPLVTLESLDDGQKIKELAIATSEFVAAKMAG